MPETPKQSSSFMITQTAFPDRLTASYRSLVQLIEKFYGDVYWQTKLLFTCLLLLFLTTTPFFNFQYFDDGSSWDTILRQADNLLIPFKGIPGSHDANKVFRLSIPLLVKLLKVNAVGLYICQIICGIIILYIVLEKAFLIIDDKVGTVFFMLAFTGCYLSYSAFYDVFGRADAFGYLFILLSIYTRNPVTIFCFCLLTAWTDERGLINTFFTALYWLYMGVDHNSSPKQGMLPVLAKLNKPVMAVFLSWIFYFAGRWYLSHYYNFHTETSGVGLGEFSKSRQYIPIGIFSTYGALWLIIIMAFFSFIYRKDWLFVGLIAIGGLLNLFVILMITDINRSLSYTIPFVFIALLELSRNLNRGAIRKLFFVTSIMALIVPIYDFDSHLHYHPNILIRIATLLADVN